MIGDKRATKIETFNLITKLKAELKLKLLGKKKGNKSIIMKQKLIQVTIKFAKLKNEGRESLKLEPKPVQSVINSFQN